MPQCSRQLSWGFLGATKTPGAEVSFCPHNCILHAFFFSTTVS
jgi:hypothetical protein